MLHLEQKPVIGREEHLTHDVRFLDHLDQIYDVQVPVQQSLTLLKVNVVLGSRDSPQLALLAVAEAFQVEHDSLTRSVRETALVEQQVKDVV